MKHETIYYWPKWLAKTWPTDKQKMIPRPLLRQLSLGQLYLWRALNIYDDFLDNEGQPKQLPLANSYYHRFLEIYYRLNLSPEFYKLFNKLLKNLDQANLRELSDQNLKIKAGVIAIPKKLPNFSKLTSLADKSLALASGPIALLFIGEPGQKFQKQKFALNFFRYALSAKQLADDSQDWFDDLMAGRITAANVLILQAARIHKIKLDLKKRPEISYLLFAQEAAPIILKNLDRLCRAARQQAKKAGWNGKTTLVEKLLKPLEEALDKARYFQGLLVKD